MNEERRLDFGDGPVGVRMNAELASKITAAIQILDDNSIMASKTWRNVALELGKTDPETFVELFEKLHRPRDEPSVKDEMIQRLIAEGNKKDAIRRCREVTGLGLKQATEIIELAYYWL